MYVDRLGITLQVVRYLTLLAFFKKKMFNLLICFLTTVVSATQITDLGYKRLIPTPSNVNVPVLFAISLNNIDLLEKYLLEVSNPKHSNYGKYLTRDQVTTLTSRPESTKHTIEWLESHGYSDVNATVTGDYVSATCTVECIESTIPFAKMYTYKVPHSTHTITRTETWKLPTALENHVDFIGYLDDFATPLHIPKQTLSTTKDKATYPPPSPGELVGNTTWQLINKVYNISSNTVRPNGGATQGLLAIGQSFNLTNLQTFAENQKVPAPYSKFTVSGVPNFPFECTHGPNNCLEASLDIETISAVAQGTPTAVWLADPNSQIWFGNYMLELINQKDPPLVVSMSYDITEHNHRPVNKDRFNVNAMKLGVRGVTVVTASGDDGVSGYMTRNTGINACGFHPSFPSTSPYVLSIGATAGPEAGKEEIACTFDNGGLISSGGGFSNYFARPSYQNITVNQYLKDATADKTLPPVGGTKGFNISGRAYPDISAMGHSYPTADGIHWYPVSGTSASTPTVAGMLTLINEARLKKGMKSVGMIGPALYSLASGGDAKRIFNDITNGCNNCCAAQTNPICCDHGFTAIKGWDPITGLGSINHGNLLEAMLKMGEKTSRTD